MRSFLGAPVSARGRVFGNIYLTEKRGADGFDADDERALVILAAQAGVAVENAHLYEELEARVQRLDALHAIGTAIVRGDDPDLVIGLVARQARALLQADLASVAVPTQGGEQLAVRTAEGAGAEGMVGEVFALAGSVAPGPEHPGPWPLTAAQESGRWWERITADQEGIRDASL